MNGFLATDVFHILMYFLPKQEANDVKLTCLTCSAASSGSLAVEPKETL